MKLRSIKKLRELIEKVMDTGKMPKGMTLCEFRELVSAYNALASGENFTTIQQNVRDTLEKCGLRTAVDGIGWAVYRQVVMT